MEWKKKREEEERGKGEKRTEQKEGKQIELRGWRAESRHFYPSGLPMLYKMMILCTLLRWE